MIYIGSSSLRLVDCMDWVNKLTLKGKRVERITLNIVYSATCYLQLALCCIYFMYISYFTNKCQIGCLDIIQD